MTLSAARPGVLVPPRDLARSLGSQPPRLFTDRSCPFAHRVLALLHHLDVEADIVECEVGQKPQGVERYSSSRRIPLLVHGDLAIHESRVMLEHLAEYHGFVDAYPRDLQARTRHRHAMATVDDFLVPLLSRALTDDERPRLEDALRAIEDAVDGVTPRPCLLAFHVAPIWLRFRWWQPRSALTRAIEAESALTSWLDAAAELESLADTAPDRATDRADLARARKAGLLPLEDIVDPQAETASQFTTQPTIQPVLGGNHEGHE